MERITPKNWEFSLPRLGVGGMRFPLLDPEVSSSIDREQVGRMVDYALAHDVNYFDTAYMYHDHTAEQVLGEALSRHKREEFLLTDKYPVWLCESEADLERIFSEQLKNCGVDYFDVYLLHALSAERMEKVQRFHMLEYFTEQKRLGRIRKLGFSFHDTPEAFEKIMDSFDWDIVQIQLNYFDWDQLEGERLYQKVLEKGIPCVVMEPVRGGLLAQLPPDVVGELTDLDPARSQASWAVRWLGDLPGVTIVLSGMSNLVQMEDNVATFSPREPLDDEERAAVDAVRHRLVEKFRIPCTGCGYCMDCPFGVQIPDQFEHYGQYHLLGNKEEYLAWYERKEGEGHGPRSCKNCKKCVSLCPQGINIPERLQEVAGFADELRK